MRRIFAIVLAALLLGVGVVAVIETDPGYVLVAYGNYTLETSLWVGLVLLLLLVWVVYFLLRLVYRLIGGQRSLTSWLGTRKAHHAQRLSTRGLINYAEGNWPRAVRQLEKGVQHNDAPLLNHLLAARASDHLQDADKVHEHLRAAAEAEPEAAVAVEITLAEMKLQAGEYQQALAALQQARNNTGKHPYTLQLMRQAYEGLGQWEELLGLLPEMKKHKLLSPQEYEALEIEVHGRRLQQATTNAERLRNTFGHLPARLKQDESTLCAYVASLIELGDHETAEKTILRALKHSWNLVLVRQYGFVQGADSSRQLSRAESWLAGQPEDAELLLCLGRLSARDKLWGKARDYFESSYRIRHTPEVCAELGRLLTELGEPKVAAAYFREGLLMCEEGLPELPMPDRVVPQAQTLARP